MSFLQASETLQDADLVRYYAEHWERYSAGASYLNHVFVYLNRYWVRRERAIGKTIYPVYTVRFYALFVDLCLI